MVVSAPCEHGISYVFSVRSSHTSVEHHSIIDLINAFVIRYPLMMHWIRIFPQLGVWCEDISIQSLQVTMLRCKHMPLPCRWCSQTFGQVNIYIEFSTA